MRRLLILLQILEMQILLIPEQTQNFLAALNQAGAGSNNNQMSSNPSGYASSANTPTNTGNANPANSNPNLYFQPQANQGVNTQNWMSNIGNQSGVIIPGTPGTSGQVAPGSTQSAVQNYDTSQTKP